MKQRPPSIPNFHRISTAIRQAVVETAEQQVRAFATKAAADFKKRILDQRFPVFHAKPLSPDTLAKKARYHRDQRVMISTRTYVDGIQVMTQRDGTKLWVVVGHDKRLLARDTKTGKPRPGITMNDVAAYNEAGSKKTKLPARPHWRPFLQDLKKLAPALRARIVRLAMTRARRSINAASK